MSIARGAHSKTSKEAIDGGLATGSITVPVWLQHLEGWMQFAAVALGLVLLIYRIWATRLEIRAHEARIAAAANDGEAE